MTFATLLAPARVVLLRSVLLRTSAQGGNAHSARVGRGRGLEVAAADCVTNDRKQMRKPPVVGNRQRLEEEVRKAPRRPRLDVGVLGVESIATGILALVEELQSFNTQSATIFNSKL